jgi:hypothetical protein
MTYKLFIASGLFLLFIAYLFTAIGLLFPLNSDKIVVAIIFILFSGYFLEKGINSNKSDIALIQANQRTPDEVAADEKALLDNLFRERLLKITEFKKEILTIQSDYEKYLLILNNKKQLNINEARTLCGEIDPVYLKLKNFDSSLQLNEIDSSKKEELEKKIRSDPHGNLYLEIKAQVFSQYNKTCGILHEEARRERAERERIAAEQQREAVAKYCMQIKYAHSQCIAVQNYTGCMKVFGFNSVEANAYNLSINPKCD